MILATDVHYKSGGGAVAAGVVFASWESGIPEDIVLKSIPRVEPYEPGQFFRRELPCLLEIIQAIPCRLSSVVIDGYVTLGDSGRPGLGIYLFEALGGSPPVIGVAKAPFRDTPEECRVYRGGSRNPLYVTSAGMPLEEAKRNIQSMHGQYRIPTTLREADRACRIF